MRRREFLELCAAATAAGLLPGAGCGRPGAPAFFTAAGRGALGALCDVVLPPDDRGPGAAAMGAVDYIERLLTVFDWYPPRLWASGPFSGRMPYNDGAGAPSGEYPPNDFETWLPLDRVTEAGWRLRLYGSAGVDGGGPNDAVLGPVEGLRDLFRRALGDAVAAAPGPLDTLDPAAREAAYAALDPAFRSALVELVLEAVLGAPEYGGNRDGAGWALAHVEGDTQPLGYSLYDYAARTYRERPEAPMSTADPAPDPDPLQDDARMWIELVTISLGGRVT
ncbi:MAG TPA: hypothetical protein VG389_23860 [Myxococcota bacterium]|nr:hypothetical protein [Myxococcota bacterium]